MAKNEKAKARVCSECGQDVDYVLVNDTTPSEQEMAEVRAMDPSRRNQEIAQAIIAVLAPSKKTKYQMHPMGAYVAFAPNYRDHKWTKAQMDKMAKKLAPFAYVAQKQMRLFPSWPRHIVI